jgi:hypothetical protein
MKAGGLRSPSSIDVSGQEETVPRTQQSGRFQISEIETRPPTVSGRFQICDLGAVDSIPSTRKGSQTSCDPLQLLVIHTYNSVLTLIDYQGLLHHRVKLLVDENQKLKEENAALRQELAGAQPQRPL